MRAVLATVAVAVVAVAAPGCGESGAGKPAPAPAAAVWDGTFAAFRDATADVSFAVPAAGYHVTARHFPRDTPPRKLKDTITVTGTQGVAVTVDVWLDPAGLPLEDWFERHLAFMRAPLAQVSRGTATAANVPAILVAQPRSEQAAGRDAAVFAVGGRKLRVTCHDRDDPRSRAVYERVLETFAPERTP